MNAPVLKIVTPVDGSLYAERPLATEAEVLAALERAKAAQRAWRSSTMAERQTIATAFVDAMVAEKDKVAELLAWQMGRPIRYGHGEMRGFEERARYMIEIAPATLADIDVGPKEGFKRYIRREPLGVCLNLPAWNFPYMTALNAVLPAILAGNTVVMKHSSQTALVAEHFASAFAKAGLWQDVFQFVNMSHEVTDKVIRSGLVDQVGFTGSTSGGRHIMASVAGATNFPATCLELGGKDPAYVRPDVNLPFAIENIVDGGFFNSGQSCCAMERVYVHEAVYDAFVEGVVATVNAYKLGSPTDQATTLGPVVRASAADFIRAQVDEALRAGAKGLIDPKNFPEAKVGTAYLAPQVLVDVDHSMRFMTEETFGPAFGIMKVKSDEEAIRLMNDSDFGLTAAIWTEDVEAAEAIGDKIETGTIYMNRCDFLDPALPWVGVKQTGRGATLSRVGYEHLTRPKSFHLRTKTS
ncbi:aldehyde dehydrogenase family protein [Kaistia dalseonensis]|uniref:Acyl-CoA reductase-like NAD-dependent aldehyde dehydrogenase n=1 Tax=Kaistia dalseonensis TaxID=410840 RepID=A0ABU0H686_9HYPH|nr:aldehyde dehydrogenase family protein [Kaistia dalseonensis]MCX5495239.1 aldehyde dehydrogenase family protein [Kaistia dalseonensis]MDQ0437825.1 acyl-CoA reductase-like NAD-dependent aldehyde dehydrogenase [Kaistia dalseonensis]